MNTWVVEAVLACEAMMGRTEQIGLGEATLTDGREEAECEDRFSELVRRQSGFVFRVAYAALRNAYDAEDVAQEVFLKLYRSGGWDRIKDERAYLARTTWRVARDRRRKTATGEALQEDAASTEQTPEETTLQANWSAVAQRLIDALPEELRLPLALSAADELNSAEIAGILGIPEGTVRTRLMKARAVLKQKLAHLRGQRHGR